jgi:hypothetical protein
LPDPLLWSTSVVRLPTGRNHIAGCQRLS